MATSTIGSGQDYATLTLWEDAKDGLAQDDTGQLTDSGNRAEADFTIDGKTSTYRWTIQGTGSAKHDGTQGSGAYITNNQSGHVITILDDNVDIEDVEIRLLNDEAASSDECIRISVDNSSSDINIRRCIVIMDIKNTNDCDGIYAYQSCTVTIENCILYNFARAAIHPQGYANNNAYITFNVFNCIIDNCSEDNEREGGAINVRCAYSGTSITINLKNTVGVDCVPSSGGNDGEFCNAYEFFVGGTITWNGDYNACESDNSGTDARMPGANSITLITPANQFTDYNNNDYHVKDTNADIYDAGIGPGSDSDIPTDDIIGTSRSGSTCDIGAFEYITATAIQGTVADAIKLSDTINRLATLRATGSDQVNASDSVDRTAIYRPAAGAGAALGESAGAIITFRPIAADQVNAADTADRLKIVSGQVIDGLNAGDTDSTIAQLLALLSDGAKYSDNTEADILGSLAGSVIDGLKFTDQASARAALAAQATDGALFADTVLNVLQALAAVTDGFKTGDVTDANIAAAAISALAADGIELSDQAAGAIKILLSTADGITLTDAGQLTANFNLVITDGAQFAATAATLARLGAQAADGALFSDVTLHFAAAGLVTAIFTGKKGTLTFTARKPGINYQGKGPKTEFN